MNNVVVLGGSSGIGKAISQRFAKEGYRVLVGSPYIDECKEVVGELEGEGHISLEIDTRRDQDFAQLIKVVKGKFEKIDVLINSFGVSQSVPAIESDFKEWDNSIQVMMYGTARACRALVPLMRNNSRIINITSIHKDRVAEGSSSYGMSKAAITQYTRSLAVELAHKNILVNCVAPGFIETPMSYKNGVNQHETQWFEDNYVKYDHLPLKRPGMPEEVSGVVWFLAGPDATYITGSTIVVDGGLTITF